MKNFNSIELIPDLGEDKLEKTEKIKEIEERYFKVAQAVALSQGGVFQGSIDHHLGNLGGRKMGTSTVYNSPMQGAQLVMSLALSHDKRIQDIVAGNTGSQSFRVEGPMKFFLEKWGGVLNGLKIIDLGCGYSPTFAKACRRLGAEVYTVDVIPSDSFDNYFVTDPWSKEKNPDEQARLEEAKRYHIQIDLADEGALSKIIKLTKGEFSLVTEAHLETGGTHEEKLTGLAKTDFAFSTNEMFYKALLKTGGVYFNPTDSRNLIVDAKMTKFQGYLELDINI